MATETLSVRLLMDAGQYKRGAREAASATGQIAGTATAAGSATSRLDRQLGNTGITMRTAVRTGALVAGAAVVGFAKDSVRAATDLNESINAVRVVFGDAAEDVLDIGENAADSFGLANSEFNAFAVRFSAFAKNIAEGDGRKVGEVVEEITGRIADFASVMNIDVAEAAEKFQSGLAGEIEPLRKFGIDVSAAATSQRALELGLAETTAELTEQDKVLARYDLIMQQTEKTAGDFANTQDDLANATRTLNANLEDFKARAGSELTPVLGELAAQGVQLFDILDPDLDLGWTQRLSAGIQLITGEGSEAVESYIEQKESINELEEAADEAASTFPIFGGAMAGIPEIADDVSEALDKQGGRWDNAVTSMQSYETALRRLTDPVFKAVNDQARLEEATQKYLDVIDDGEATVGEQEQAMWDLVAAQIAAEESAAELPDDMRASADSIEIVGRRAGITEGDLGRLRDMIDSFDGRVARATIEVAVRRTGAPIDPSIIADAELGQRQHGGPVRAGHPYVVGEAGPELFIPQSSGVVLSNRQSMSNGSPVGGTVVNNYFALTWGDFVRKAADAGLEIQRYGW